MQHSLQHVFLTLIQVSKINRQSIQNFIKNNGFEYGVKCIYTKTLFFKAVLTEICFLHQHLCQFANYCYLCCVYTSLLTFKFVSQYILYCVKY